MVAKGMRSNLKSIECEAESTAEPETPGWFRVGVLAAASAVVGGLAVAWYYRSTLARLRQAEGLPPVELDVNSEGEGI